MRLRILVDDNGTLHYGSSVIRLSCIPAQNRLTGLSTHNCDIDGEAVPVELGQNRVLVMTFTHPGDLDYDGITETIRTSRDPTELMSPDEAWPIAADKLTLLVTFTDRTKPATVKAVDPTALDKAFGPGVILRSLTAEPSDDPVTHGQIERALPWLHGFNTMLDGETDISTPALKSRLRAIDFERHPLRK